MPIFARRVLQRMLDENAKHLSQAVIASHVERLNRRGRDSIAAEWEVAVIHGLLQLGDVRFETAAASGKRPDVHFGSDSVRFTGEITSVSDAGVAKKNPMDRFWTAFCREILKQGLPGRGFNLTVGSRTEGEGRSRKEVLALPAPKEWPHFFGPKFDCFLKAVEKEPGVKRRTVWRESGTDVVIDYDPEHPGLTASYATYDTPQSLTHNPTYNALETESDQLRSVKGTKLIFLCDAGSAALRSRCAGSRFTTEKIIDRFFRDHSIDGVCVLTIERKPRIPLGQLPPPYLRVEAYFRHSAVRAEREKLDRLLGRLAEVIPSPECGAGRALEEFVHSSKPEGCSHWGGYTVNEGTVRVSARAVLGLLAGGVSQEQFLKDHGFVPGAAARAANPFVTRLSQGYLIDRVEVEKSTVADDDWLVFHFTGPDAAVTSFRARTAPQEE